MFRWMWRTFTFAASADKARANMETLRAAYDEAEREELNRFLAFATPAEKLKRAQADPNCHSDILYAALDTLVSNVMDKDLSDMITGANVSDLRDSTTKALENEQARLFTIDKEIQRLLGEKANSELAAKAHKAALDALETDYRGDDPAVKELLKRGFNHVDPDSDEWKEGDPLPQTSPFPTGEWNEQQEAEERERLDRVEQRRARGHPVDLSKIPVIPAEAMEALQKEQDADLERQLSGGRERYVTGHANVGERHTIGPARSKPGRKG